MKYRKQKYRDDFNKLIFPYQHDLISVFFTVVHSDITSFRKVIHQLARQTYRSFELWIFFKDNEILDALNSQIPLDLRGRVRTISILSEDEGISCSSPSGEFLLWLDQSSILAADCFDQLVARFRANPSLEVTNPSFDPQYISSSHPLIMRSRAAWLLGYVPRSNQNPEWTLFWRYAELMLHIHCSDPGDLCNESIDHNNRGEEPDIIVDDDVKTDTWQDFLLSPSVFQVIENGRSQRSIQLAQRLREAIIKTGNFLDVADNHRSTGSPAFWTSKIILVIADSPGASYPELKEDSKHAFAALICCSSDSLHNSIPEEWDAGFVFGSNFVDLPKTNRAFQGWIGFEDVVSALRFVDARAHLFHLKRLEDAIEQIDPPTLRTSIVITTFRRTSALRDALRSALMQTFQQNDYEIIVVNNDPQDQNVGQVIDEAASEKSLRPEMIRQIQCVIPGLSHARNAGISAARGEVICFLDDDAMAHATWLQQIAEAFSAHPETGVIGGHIQLIIPEPRPEILLDGLERYWTHFLTSYQHYTEVSHWLEYPWGANWCARRDVLFEIGGFRSQYGRKKNDFSGGEEIIAASLARKLGYSVAILPNAIVDHCPDPSRYTYHYLCNTIAAQSIVNYRMSRDLYLPKDVSLSHNLSRVRNFLRRFSQILHLPAQQRKARMIETFCFIKSWPRLFYEQMNDNFLRAFYHE